MIKTLTITAIITSVILLSGILGFVTSSNDAFAGALRVCTPPAVDDGAGGCVLPPPTVGALEHYLDYQIKDMKNPKFQKFNVLLEDQFEIATYQVKKPVKLLNPVDKNLEGVIDWTTHYVGYQIKGPHNPVTDILVVNQFGSITVDTKKADLLLVPSLKSERGPVAFGALISADHFKCYKVEVTEGTPEFVPQEVLLRDQFLDKEFLVKEPTRLCTPAIKNGEGGNDGPDDFIPPRLADPGGFICDLGRMGCDLRTFDHLMCYKVKEIDKQPKFQKRTIWTLNQFGPDVFDVKKVKELCVPSLKILEEPEPACRTAADCDDTNVCNGAETCEAGQCVTGVPPVCAEDPNECTAARCDAELGGCVVEPVREGEVCLSIEGTSVCQNGLCVPEPGEPTCIETCQQEFLECLPALDICQDSFDSCIVSCDVTPIG